MSGEYPRRDRIKALSSLPELFKKIDEEETVDFENGRVTLMARIHAERAVLQAEYEGYATAPVDTSGETAPSSRMRDLRMNAAALFAVWDALQQKDLFTHPYKEKPLFAHGCAYATRAIHRDLRFLRERAEHTTDLSTTALEEYRRLRNQLAILSRLQFPINEQQRTHDIALEGGYEYQIPTRPPEQLLASANLVELWPRLKAGVRLCIATQKREIHLEIVRAYIANDTQLVIEGRITLGEPDMPTHTAIRIVTERGSNPRASISLSEQERLPLVRIKRFSLEKKLSTGVK